jgi:hypothetical protein
VRLAMVALDVDSERLHFNRIVFDRGGRHLTASRAIMHELRSKRPRLRSTFGNQPQRVLIFAYTL